MSNKLTIKPVLRLGTLFRPATFRHFVCRQDGTAAIEFAVVIIPFLAIVFAIMETALVFFAGQTLETAVADSSRMIMTGQAQAKSLNQETFRLDICARILGLFDCKNGVKVDVRTYTAFSAADVSKPVDSKGNLQTNFTYQPGCPGDIVVVRAVYQWPVFVSLLGLNLADMAGSTRLLMATAAFRNEPYSATCTPPPVIP